MIANSKERHCARDRQHQFELWTTAWEQIKRYVLANQAWYGSFPGCNTSDVVQLACLSHYESVGSSLDAALVLDPRSLRRAADLACSSVRTRENKRKSRERERNERCKSDDRPSSDSANAGQVRRRYGGSSTEYRGNSPEAPWRIAQREECRVVLQNAIERGLSNLSALELKILQKRARGERFHRIAVDLGISRQRAQRRLASAVRKLQMTVRPLQSRFDAVDLANVAKDVDFANNPVVSSNLLST